MNAVFEIWKNVRAFPQTFRGTEEQIGAYREMENMFIEYGRKLGAHEEFTNEELAKAREMHARIMRLWPELLEWRQNLPPFKSTDMGKDIEGHTRKGT